MTERALTLRRGPADWVLAGEALVWLALAAIAIRGLSFEAVAGLASRVSGAERPVEGAIDRVAWAIDAATVRAPWRPLCFERGLAACLMLRRRGGRPTLYYGALSNDLLGLKAHVWVRVAGRDVVGGEEAAQFAVLATFPPTIRQHDEFGEPTP